MKRISEEPIIYGLIMLGLITLIVIFATTYERKEPLGPAVLPNLECFQVVGKDSPSGTLAIQVYWCRDLTNNELCYWWNPVQGLALTRCNRTIFREND